MNSTISTKFFCLLYVLMLMGCQETPPGGESTVAPSQIAGVAPTTQAKPGRMSITSAHVGDGEVNLGFTLSELADSYTIKYRPVDSVNFISILGANSPQVISGLTNGVSYVIKVAASNSAGVTDSNLVMLTPVTVSPMAPVAQGLSAVTTEDIQAMVFLPYVDGNGDLATACALSGLSNLTITQACSCTSGVCSVGVTGTANFFGNASFNYTVTAGGDTSAPAAALISVAGIDDAPVALDITPMPFAEDTQSIITLSYTDAEADLATSCAITNLTNVIVSQACACVAGVCTVGVKGTSNYYGAASFSYTVTANSRLSNLATAPLDITAVDDAPVASNISPAAFDEDTQSIITLVYTDQENDLAVSCELPIAHLNNVTVTQACNCVDGVCTVGVTGTANYYGSASFKYTVTANGLASSEATAFLSINPVDDAPVTYAIAPVAFPEDLQSVITLSHFDVEGDHPTACTLDSLNNVTITKACLCSNNVCTVGVTGTSNYFGIATFSYQVMANGLSSNWSTATLLITAVDDPPMATNITPVPFDEDTESIITLSYTDIESDEATGCEIFDLNNVRITTACVCVSGDCTVGVTGFTDYYGQAEFKYTVTANFMTSAYATASLTINPVDDAPVAKDLPIQDVKKETDITLALSYTDVEGDLATSCVTSNPINLIVTPPCACIDGICTVTVRGNNGYSGAASFQYTVTANGLTSNTATSSLNVLDDNPPVALAITAHLFFNEEKTVYLAYSDSDGDAATACSVTPDPIYAAETQPCSCASGICSVGLRGNAYNSPGPVTYGSYTVWANGALSSSANISFSCPIGYALVPPNASLGTSTFCVMQYEAKENAGEAVSTYEFTPHVNVTMQEAVDSCRDRGPQFDLISNPEWMAIARNIEANAYSNLTSYFTGPGYSGYTPCYRSGNVGDFGAAHSHQFCSTPLTGEEEAHFGLDRSERARHKLSNGQYIWDFSGNVEEWALWLTNRNLSALDNVNYTNSSYLCSWNSELNNITSSCNPAPPSGAYLPNNISYEDVNRIGYFITGQAWGITRGGNFSSGTRAGIYTLDFSRNYLQTYSEVGYRCVFRP